MNVFPELLEQWEEFGFKEDRTIIYAKGYDGIVIESDNVS